MTSSQFTTSSTTQTATYTCYSSPSVFHSSSLSFSQPPTVNRNLLHPIRFLALTPTLRFWICMLPITIFLPLSQYFSFSFPRSSFCRSDLPISLRVAQIYICCSRLKVDCSDVWLIERDVETLKVWWKETVAETERQTWRRQGMEIPVVGMVAGGAGGGSWRWVKKGVSSIFSSFWFLHFCFNFDCFSLLHFISSTYVLEQYLLLGEISGWKRDEVRGGIIVSSAFFFEVAVLLFGLRLE